MAPNVDVICAYSQAESGARGRGCCGEVRLERQCRGQVGRLLRCPADALGRLQAHLPLSLRFVCCHMAIFDVPLLILMFHIPSWCRRQRRPVRLRPRLHRRLQRARLIRPLRRHQIRPGEHYNYRVTRCSFTVYTVTHLVGNSLPLT